MAESDITDTLEDMHEQRQRNEKLPQGRARIDGATDGAVDYSGDPIHRDREEHGIPHHGTLNPGEPRLREIGSVDQDYERKDKDYE